MKRLMLTLALLFPVLIANAQIIDNKLIDELNRRDDDEKIEIFVLMKTQYDRMTLNHRAGFFNTRSDRRQFVVSELKAFAEASQYDLRHSLNEMEQQGLVTAPRSLWSANALYFSASKTAIMNLGERSDIQLIGFDHKENLIPETSVATPSTPSREITPNIVQVNADKVWELGYTGAGVVVAVVDSGVNYDHPDLADHLWDGGDEFPHHGYDIVNDDDDPMDDKGHGTHVAGIVCGDGTSGTQTGVAPDATLMCVKSTAVDGFGGSVNIAGGMEWAVEHGCDMISMSLGMAGAGVADKEILRRTCEAVLDAGIVATVCAGNEGNFILLMAYPIPDNVRVPASCPPPYLDPDQLANPGAKSCVIAVGAVNSNDAAADFTSQGPVTWQDTEFGDYAYNPGIGLIRPDVCAPGVHIKSLDFENLSNYIYMDGTSQATPCVGGIIALMLQKNPDLMPDEICQILEETSLKLTPNKSNITGVGRVDALAAINAVPDWDGVADSHVAYAFVFPNPSHDGFTIQCEGMIQIEVFSLDGKLIQNAMVDSDTHFIEGLENGIYVLYIKKEDHTLIQKIVKY